MKEPKELILIGSTFRKFPTKKSKSKKSFGIYLCECGKKFKAYEYSVKNGDTKSCGCYNARISSERRFTHGLSKTDAYKVWGAMIGRTKKTFKNARDYYDKGIRVCDEWKSPEVFIDWALNNGFKKGLQLDRTNNDKGYSPNNCRFVTQFVNNQNTRKLQSNNTSGYRGVSLPKGRKRWIAVVHANGKRNEVGSFETKIEAAYAYDNYVIINKLENTRNFNG